MLFALRAVARAFACLTYRAALCGLFVVFRQAPDWEKPEGWLLKKGEKRSNWTRRWPAPGPISPKGGACVIGGEGNGFW